MAEVLEFPAFKFPPPIHFPFELCKFQSEGGLFCNPARELLLLLFSVEWTESLFPSHSSYFQNNICILDVPCLRLGTPGHFFFFC